MEADSRPRASELFDMAENGPMFMASVPNEQAD
jgi:hypothetical protein